MYDYSLLLCPPPLHVLVLQVGLISEARLEEGISWALGVQEFHRLRWVLDAREFHRLRWALDAREFYRLRWMLDAREFHRLRWALDAREFHRLRWARVLVGLERLRWPLLHRAFPSRSHVGHLRSLSRRERKRGEE